MHRILCVLIVVSSVVARAQSTPSPERKEAKDTTLKKKAADAAPDKSLAGDVTRKKEKHEAAPTLTYDTFRLGIEGQVATKRQDQIKDLKQIIEMSQDKKEKPGLYFRLGELYWEESKHFFFEANRKDDEKIQAMNRDDKAGVERVEAAKKELLDKSKEQAQLAVEQYSRIVQEYRDFERTDEVLYFLGLNLMEMGDEKRGLLAYNRLIDKYKKSKYLPDAYLAVGEFHFNGSKGKRDVLEKALDKYKNAANYPENAVYGYAMYKQGWCYFNMGDFEQAMDKFKAVVLYAKLAGTQEAEGGAKGTKTSRAGLVRESRNDFVRAYSRLLTGSPSEAKERFSKLADTPDELRTMMKGLANLYYDDGKDKEAAVAYDMLIKERPISPDAPGFQGRIVDCVMRAGAKRQTVQQVRRLVKVMDEVLKGNPKLDDKQKKELDEARDLSERTISNLAVNWHNEAKKTRDEETFGFANEVYADYLTLFPESPKAYDLRFFWADLNDHLEKYERSAEEYTKVSQQDIARIQKNEKVGKHFADATFNAIVAWDNVVKAQTAAGKIKPEVATDPTKKLDIPPAKKGLLEASERYIKYVEKGDKKVETAYKVARIYYEYNWLDEAIARFADIALKYPDYKFDNDRAGEVCANLVLDSYNLMGDSQKVNEWARKFYAEEKLATGKFREDLLKIIEQSSFKLVNQLEARKDYALAADGYMKFVGEFPKSEYSDKALVNAAICFFNARMLDKAIEVRKTIVTKYPKSPFVPQTMFALAEGYEAIADFENSADYYEAYANAYEKAGHKKAGKAAPPAPKKDAKGEKDSKEQVWDETKAQDALFNAGIFRDGLAQYKAALRDREKYLELWPESKDAEAVTKSIIDIYEKMQAWARAQKELEDYERKYMKDPDKMLIAEGRIAAIFEDKMKNPAGAKRIYKRILDFYGQLSKKQKDNLDIRALDAVARATFSGNEDDFKHYAAMKLKWTALANINELKGSIGAKAKSLDELQKTYTKTVTLKSADPAICALHKIGLAYDQFAQMLENPPTPKGMPGMTPEQLEDLLREVKAQFAEQAKPIKDKATEAFTAAVTKSQELDIFNPCTTAALEMLRTRYNPTQFPRMREDVLELKFEPGKQMVFGGDVLSSIQPIPTVSAEKVADMKARAKEVGKDVADLGSGGAAPELDLNEAPKKNTAPTPAVKKAVEPTPSVPRKATTPAGNGKKDDEPEDSL